jgi:hypothetical protein
VAEELEAQERRELERWRSGSLRKSWPVVKSVPDGLRYAAELARAQGTEGGDEHDELLRQAAIRLRDMNDAARVLVAERDLLLWLHAEAVWKAGQFQTALRQERALAEDLDDRRARWAEEHEKRRDELEQVQASRRAWAEEAMRLHEVLIKLSNDLGEAGLDHLAVAAASHLSSSVLPDGEAQ